ncbi:TPR repeat-containing protein, partial [Reticulomyxa filosa]
FKEQSKNNNNNLFKRYQNNCNIYLIFLVLAIILLLYNAIPVRWYTYLGDYYYNNKQYDKTIEYYEKVLTISKTSHKESALLYSDLANFYYKNDQWSNAIKNYENAFKHGLNNSKQHELIKINTIKLLKITKMH